MKQKIEYELKKIGSAEVLNRVREGRFQVSVLKMNMVKVASDKSQRDFVPEIQFDRVRTCIQYSTYSKSRKEWNNQQIWCNSPAELVQLRDVLNQILGEASDEASSSLNVGEQSE